MVRFWKAELSNIHFYRKCSGDLLFRFVISRIPSSYCSFFAIRDTIRLSDFVVSLGCVLKKTCESKVVNILGMDLSQKFTSCYIINLMKIFSGCSIHMS